MNNMLKWTAIAFVILPFLDARIVTQQGRSYSRFFRREVPQEHSHDLIINQLRDDLWSVTEPLIDPIYGTLGNGAIQKELDSSGKKMNPDCVQQNLADQAIEVAKGDIRKIATAIKYRALERNTLTVGAASKACSEQPKSEHLQGLQQHQDPAFSPSPNRDVELGVAKALLKLGLSQEEAVLGALETATFAPAKPGTEDAKGNSCDAAPGQKDGEPVKASEDGKDPITGVGFKKGDTIDCITLADVQNGQSKRVPALSKEELTSLLSSSVSSPSSENGNNSPDSSNKEETSVQVESPKAINKAEKGDAGTPEKKNQESDSQSEEKAFNGQDPQGKEYNENEKGESESKSISAKKEADKSSDTTEEEEVEKTPSDDEPLNQDAEASEKEEPSPSLESETVETLVFTVTVTLPGACKTPSPQNLSKIV